MVTAPQAADLAHRAEQAAKTGRIDESTRLWTQVLALDANHPRGLFVMGQRALLEGNAPQAISLLQRAAQAAPADPTIPLNLSFAYRALRDSSNELAALESALAIDPYFFPALLAKGAALERAGKSRLAASTYKDALIIAPPDDVLPESLKSGVTRARAAVAENAAKLEKFLNERLRGKTIDAEPQQVSRIQECTDIVLGKKKVYVQQPTLLHFPGLPATPYYDRAHFEWLPQLEAATPSIREELLALMRDSGEFSPYVQYPAGVPLNQWSVLNFSPKWSAYFFWKNDIRDDQHCRQCPRTAAAIEALPRADIPQFAPTAFFSVLEPKTPIPPHTGVTNARLTVHLPLIVPPGGCWFRVGNETREWKEGEAWVFDDTIEHEAYNPTDQTRVILIFDVWNPHLSAVEREAIRGLLPGLNEYYSA